MPIQLRNKMALAAITTLVVGLGSSALATASPVGTSPGAAAVDCNLTGPDLDNRSYTKEFMWATNVRSGPSQSCRVVGVGYPENSIDYHCWTEGDGGTWTYLRTRNTVYGWVKDSELSDYGSIKRC